MTTPKLAHEKLPLAAPFTSYGVQSDAPKVRSGQQQQQAPEYDVEEIPLTYDLYPKRWFVLASFCLLNFSNGWAWITWSPLTVLVAEYWDVTEGAVDALSGIFMFVFVPVNVISMWLVVNYLGLSKGLFIGAVVHMTGLAVRYGGGYLADASMWFSEYQIVFFGTFLCALAQTFVLPMITLLSGNWFGELERATATSLGVLSNQLGSLIGLGSTAIVDFRLDGTDEIDGNKLGNYLLLQWIVSLVALVMIAVNLTSDRPPTPPSAAAAMLEQDGKGTTVKYRASIRLILENPACRSFFLLFGLAVGVFYAIPTFLSQFLRTWPPHMQGWLGSIFQIAAVLGCFAAGNFVSWFELQYKKVCMMLLSGCLASLVLYLISVYYQSTSAFLACGGLGFFFASFMSVGIEYGTALTFPADEGAVYGILDSTGELCGFALVMLGGFMSHIELLVPFCGIMVGFVAIALVMLWRLRGLSRRPSSFMKSQSSSLTTSTSFMSPISSFIED
eukprot:scaffold6764_cov169-Amphora_coffeaeformis.AAC.5